MTQQHLKNLYAILKMNTEGHHRTCECTNCEEYFEILNKIAEEIYEKQARIFDN